ncbi:proline iminopeptidase [Shimia isoporae]|uniref:Proline iminopeptidase n=1 Tax=Shimia isoporae TaxID=647720 RepID=A0A4V2Q1T8_9RHOB|nr:alpha/beta hydrolase [Shimia isoporae]TCK98901.1 proline iminopeptidase [Shimia isoporae]
MHLNVNGTNIFFDVVGSKLLPVGDEMVERPTMLVLHGGPGFDHSTLRPHFDRYADAFQVIYIDHRANGRSEGDIKDCSLDQWADDIAAFCEALRIERPVVFGQSFGGMVAMHYASRHPDGSSKLVLSSTAACFLMEETEKMMAHLGGKHAAELAREFFTNPSVEVHEEYARVCLPLYSQTPPEEGSDFRGRAISRPEIGVHFFANEMMEMDLRGGISAVSCPTLVLGGQLDPVTPPQCSEDIANAIGENAQLTMFDGCGHGVHRDQPDAAEKVMRAFLE